MRTQNMVEGKAFDERGNVSAPHGERDRIEELDNEAIVRELVRRLGGINAAFEQMTAVMEDGGGAQVNSEGVPVDEDTPGYCYLRLLDRVEHRDASAMGPYPTAADVRRFTNRRTSPFGARAVTIVVCAIGNDRVAHVEYRGGDTGLRPVSALAAIAKDVRVGGLPDGVSDSFPEDWIPADFAAVVTWDYVAKDSASRALDALEWLGDYPTFLRKRFEPISASTSRLRWTVRADPLGPSTATVDVIDSNGKVSTARRWVSHVAHTGYHQNWKVRGNKVFIQLDIWRAAKMLSDPTSPAPLPTPDPTHGDLLQMCVDGTRSGGIHLIPIVEDGHCYASAFVDRKAAIEHLGSEPTVGSILDYAKQVGDKGKSDRASLLLRDSGLHHAEDRDGKHANFWSDITALDLGDQIGATQDRAVKQDEMENVSSAPLLTLRPKTNGVLLNVPFVCLLDSSKTRMLWDLTAGQKLSTLMSYFESVELVSLHIKVTVHKGDNDTLVSLVADTMDTWLTQDEDWVGAAHTLHVSGNTNGATSGEFKLEGHHGFGTQLKGVSVGNPTPIIQAKLDTNVSATAYLKAMLTVRATGTGLPKAMVLAARPAKGGLNGSAN